jgi:hypothetical protein
MRPPSEQHPYQSTGHLQEDKQSNIPSVCRGGRPTQTRRHTVCRFCASCPIPSSCFPPQQLSPIYGRNARRSPNMSQMWDIPARIKDSPESRRTTEKWGLTPACAQTKRQPMRRCLLAAHTAHDAVTSAWSDGAPSQPATQAAHRRSSNHAAYQAYVQPQTSRHTSCTFVASSAHIHSIFA